MKKLLLVVALLVIAGICLAQFAARPDWVTFTRTSDTTGTIRWATTPSDFVVYYYLSIMPDTDLIYFPEPTGGEPPWNGGAVPGASAPLGDYLEAPGVYKWDSPLVLNPAINYIAYVAAVNGGWAWDIGSIASSFHNPPPVLPVELSSFSAIPTAQNYVKLTWISQSETNLLGYRVYRGETSNQIDAVNVSPIMIPATNTTTTQSYNFTDEEVERGVSYYYWLVSIEWGQSNFHGPVNVTTSADTPPSLTEMTIMRDAQANPFRTNEQLSIEVLVKAGEKGQLTIYNVAGQTVKTYNVSEGQNLLNWNGKDGKGNSCSAGIYFYKLNTPSLNQTKKLIIIK